MKDQRRTRLVIVNRGRFAMFLGLCTLLLFAAGLWIGSWHTASARAFEVESYRVVNGDTLWDLAKARTPASRDCREYIHEVISINDLQTVNLAIGQEIDLPIWNQTNE